jgi:alkylated DNA repair protein alkB family protein 6
MRLVSCREVVVTTASRSFTLAEPLPDKRFVITIFWYHSTDQCTEYLPGQGIMSHVDGPMYFPAVANLSLGSHTIMNLQECRVDCDVSPPQAPIRLLLEPRSLLLLSSHAYVLNYALAFLFMSSDTSCDRYVNWMHGIEELTEDAVDSSVANIHLTSFSGADQASPPTCAIVLARSTRVSLTIRYVPKVLTKHSHWRTQHL